MGQKECTMVDQRVAQDGEEELGAKLFKFEREGDTLDGTIEEYSTIEIDGKPADRVVLKEFHTGEKMAILLTVQLKDKMGGLPVSTRVRIVYEFSVAPNR
jgi:hypothetical protein